tara:strand:+ start:1297 stop:1476 length:180 start_codon:yes stop_codon:yes gene_type:complete
MGLRSRDRHEGDLPKYTRAASGTNTVKNNDDFGDLVYQYDAGEAEHAEQGEGKKYDDNR